LNEDESLQAVHWASALKRHLFHVSSEGGPLVVADALLARHWNGVENGGADYDRLCEMFDQTPEPEGVVFQIFGEMAFAWEMGGEGTADIFRLQSGDVRIVRAWTDADPPDDELMALAEADSRDQISLGIIRVPSRRLAIFWAPESGALIPERIEGGIHEVRGTSMASTSYVMSVETETFVCLHDEVETESSQARRLTLRAI
jgi:hypothetical protein